MPLMLPHAPQFSRYESNVSATPAVNFGTQVNNPAGAANTKNTTWTELIASSAFDASLVIVTVMASSAANTNTATLIDIGIGASTAETVLIPDLLAGWVTGASYPGSRHYIFPLRVPAGSRISARSQSVRTSGSTYVLVELWGGPRNPDGWWSGTQVTAYGVNTADSGGTPVTAGNTGSEGSATSIGTTTSHHECLVLGVQGLDSGTVMTADLVYHCDVGIDTASTAWLTQDQFQFISSSGESTGPRGQVWWPIFAPVPSGSVLVVGAECSGTAQAIDFAIYGVS